MFFRCMDEMYNNRRQFRLSGSFKLIFLSKASCVRERVSFFFSCLCEKVMERTCVCLERAFKKIVEDYEAWFMTKRN